MGWKPVTDEPDSGVRRRRILEDLERQRHTKRLADIRTNFNATISRIEVVKQANEEHYKRRLKTAASKNSSRPSSPASMPKPEAIRKPATKTRRTRK